MFSCCISPSTDSPRGNKSSRPPAIDSGNFTDVSRSPHEPPMGAEAAQLNSLRQHMMKKEAGVTSALDDVISGIQNNEGDGRSIMKCRQLGRGGFGVVWLATMDNGRTKIALKELNEPFIFVPNSKDSQEKLKQLPFSEAAIQSLMVQKNIVRTLWADVSIVDPDTHEPLGIRFKDVVNPRGGGPASTEWTQIDNIANIASNPSAAMAGVSLPQCVGLNMRIVMEYCEFGSLYDYLSPGTPDPSQPRALPLNIAIGNSMERTLCAEMTALDIARGLRLLHKSRVIHGDLKPHNILLARDPEDPRGFVAKVSDFGLSRHLAKGANEIGGITHGSPAYMSPESLRERAVTYRSDIFALGVIMWELWHNTCWSSIFDVYKKKNNLNWAQMQDFLPKCHPTCPSEYVEIVDKCIQKDPMQRPRSQDVTHWLENCISERRGGSGEAPPMDESMYGGSFGSGR